MTNKDILYHALIKAIGNGYCSDFFLTRSAMEYLESFWEDAYRREASRWYYSLILIMILQKHFGE